MVFPGNPVKCHSVFFWYKIFPFHGKVQRGGELQPLFITWKMNEKCPTWCFWVWFSLTKATCSFEHVLNQVFHLFSPNTNTFYELKFRFRNLFLWPLTCLNAGNKKETVENNYFNLTKLDRKKKIQTSRRGKLYVHLAKFEYCKDKKQQL